jgi:hypothetical protein
MNFFQIHIRDDVSFRRYNYKDRMKVEEFLKPLGADYSLVSHAKFDSVWTVSFCICLSPLEVGYVRHFLANSRIMNQFTPSTEKQVNF